MLEVLGVWTKFVSTKLLSLWKGCWMLLTALLGMGASLFLVIWVKLGWRPLPGSGSLDLGVASLDPDHQEERCPHPQQGCEQHPAALPKGEELCGDKLSPDSQDF